MTSPTSPPTCGRPASLAGSGVTRHPAAGAALHREWVARVSPRSLLNRASSDAAVLLHALCDLAPNVERLAHLLGLSQPFVARCLRRLVDNGVLEAGRLVVAWHPVFEPRAFEADLNVALGLWRRLRTAADGRLVWAPSAELRKCFDWERDAGPDGGADRYYPAPSGAPAAEALVLPDRDPLRAWADPLPTGRGQPVVLGLSGAGPAAEIWFA